MLSLLSEKWNNSIHQFGENKIVALDISKAIDKVWHAALMAKLAAFGLGSSPTNLLCRLSNEVDTKYLNFSDFDTEILPKS